MRYGLDDKEGPHTLQEVATILKLSRERVRQLEKDALTKLRHPSRRMALQDCFQ